MWGEPEDYFCAKEPPIEATWEEFSSFHREVFRSLTFSEHDHLEKTSLFYLEQDVPTYGAFDRDFVPLNFLSSFFLHTHKGNEKRVREMEKVSFYFMIYCINYFMLVVVMAKFLDIPFSRR
jgi:hypothetical protein